MTWLPNSAPAWLTPKYWNFFAPSQVLVVGVGTIVEVVVVDSWRLTTGEGRRACVPVANNAITKLAKAFISMIHWQIISGGREQPIFDKRKIFIGFRPTTPEDADR